MTRKPDPVKPEEEHRESQGVVVDQDFMNLLEASSLGRPAARRIRSLTPAHVAEEMCQEAARTRSAADAGQSAPPCQDTGDVPAEQDEAEPVSVNLYLASHAKFPQPPAGTSAPGIREITDVSALYQSAADELLKALLSYPDKITLTSRGPLRLGYWDEWIADVNHDDIDHATETAHGAGEKEVSCAEELWKPTPETRDEGEQQPSWKACSLTRLYAATALLQLARRRELKNIAEIEMRGAGGQLRESRDEIRVMVVGRAGAGKSSLISALLWDEYSQIEIPSEAGARKSSFITGLVQDFSAGHESVPAEESSWRALKLSRMDDHWSRTANFPDLYHHALVDVCAHALSVAMRDIGQPELRIQDECHRLTLSLDQGIGGQKRLADRLLRSPHPAIDELILASVLHHPDQRRTMNGVFTLFFRITPEQHDVQVLDVIHGDNSWLPAGITSGLPFAGPASSWLVDPPRAPGLCEDAIQAVPEDLTGPCIQYDAGRCRSSLSQHPADLTMLDFPGLDDDTAAGGDVAPSVDSRLLDRPVHRLIVAVDIEGSAKRDRSVKNELRHILYELLDQALAATGITGKHLEQPVDRGDGVLILIRPHDDIPKTMLPGRLIPLLTGLLAARNASAPRPELRLQLRAVVHAGEIRKDHRGYYGEDLDTAFRLLDAPALKKALRKTAAPSLVLAISGVIFQEINEKDGFPGKGSYCPVSRFRSGRRKRRGWVHIPEPADPLDVTLRAGGHLALARLRSSGPSGPVASRLASPQAIFTGDRPSQASEPIPISRAASCPAATRVFTEAGDPPDERLASSEASRARHRMRFMLAAAAAAALVTGAAIPAFLMTGSADTTHGRLTEQQVAERSGIPGPVTGTTGWACGADLTFAPGEYRLSRSVKADLRSWAKEYGHETGQVTIDGYGDASAGESHGNLELAMKRARAVAAFLESAGVPASRLTVTEDRLIAVSSPDYGQVMIWMPASQTLSPISTITPSPSPVPPSSLPEN